MNKSKLLALVVGVCIFSGGIIAYAAQTWVDPELVVSKPPQPRSTAVPAGALHVPFTNVDLTARGSDIIVEEIVVKQVGPADDELFDEILLLDGNGEELGDGTLDHVHTVHFTEPILIPQNTTLHVTVAGNMVEDFVEFEGQMPALSVVEISASADVKVVF